MGYDPLAKPRRMNKLVWFVLPLLVIAALVVGGFSMSRANAAESTSPLSGLYYLRAIVTSGPYTGMYLTGGLSLTINGNGNVKGAVCGLKISEQRCSSVVGTGTTDGSIINFAVTHLKGRNLHGPGLVTLPAGSFSGGYLATAGKRGGFDGYIGTFILGTSSGTWEARVGVAPRLSSWNTSSSWNVYGKVLSGPDKGHMFHGVLTLTETKNGHLTGTYCARGVCFAVTGGRDLNGYIYFYVDVHINISGPQIIRLRGMVMGGGTSRLSGQFETLNKSWDRGYWLGH
jgi:hypothetical protein